MFRALAEEAPLLRTDVERTAAEAAKPLPKGSTWHKNGGEELEKLLAYTTLIDAKWLLKLARGKGIVPAWQDVPPEAVVTLDDLRASTMHLILPVAVLSYGWAAKQQ